MAAIGGDTIVPTNWRGLLVTVVVIAALASATYFLIDWQFGAEDTGEQVEEGATLQEMFSSKRSYESEAKARASARVFASGPSRDDTSADQDQDEVGADDGGDDVQAELDAFPDRAEPEPPAEPASAQGAAAPNSTDDAETARASTDTPASPARGKAPRSGKSSTTSSKSQGDTPSAKSPALPAAEALRAWWANPPAPSGSLAIRYVGAMDRGDQPSNAIAIMFSERVEGTAAGNHIDVRGESGQTVTGSWQSGRNPNLLFLEGLDSGRYEVSVREGLTSASGKALKQTVAGPIFIY